MAVAVTDVQIYCIRLCVYFIIRPLSRSLSRVSSHTWSNHVYKYNSVQTMAAYNLFVHYAH